MKTALTIAGADPSGGAGIQTDLKAFSSFGVLGLSVITSLTAQNNGAVRAKLVIPPSFLRKQVDALVEEFRIDAVKVGMLGSSANATAVARVIERYGLKNVVLDTVLSSTGGFPLIDGKGVEAIRKLARRSTVITPNIPEAEALSGVEIKTVEEMEKAAKEIFALGPEYVLIKGGHLKGSPVDVLYDGRRFDRFPGARVRGRAGRFHGTGCILSAGIAAGLANGRPVRKAVAEAKGYLEKVIRERG
ncbi:MAG: bifunctional hydroxymethylpyrimidine kinase/phosphomethylpyrimidine kinase [Deltaproteobacteria bacterium]|nr:bifunctional hydroxymethylpyrimidine kinase/phosphomethylpyrimidine kinase [Deltaproteobacteria bacterium]